MKNIKDLPIKKESTLRKPLKIRMASSCMKKTPENIRKLESK